jgi:hypothetical protein
MKMRFLSAMAVLISLSCGGGAAAAPQLEYLVIGDPDAVAGMPGGRQAWEVRDSLGRFFNYRITGDDQAGFRYKEEARMVHNLAVDGRGLSLLLDWHPVAGRFRFSGGLLSYEQSLNYAVAPEIDERFKYEIRFDPRQTMHEVAQELRDLGFDVDMNELESYLPEDTSPRVITINRRVRIDARDLSAHARVKYESVAPYLGFGWGTPFASDGRLRYSLDIGVLYQSAPEIDLTVRGDVLEDAQPAVSTWLGEWAFKQELKLHRKLEKQSVSPRIGFGLSYRLF